jgi:S-disulfanyl-L-cysteine oxidoreductase SoxD
VIAKFRALCLAAGSYRDMLPPNAPRSLTDDEVYAVAAYTLRLNGIIGDSDVMNAQTLPKAGMPNRHGFVLFSRPR